MISGISCLPQYQLQATFHTPSIILMSTHTKSAEHTADPAEHTPDPGDQTSQKATTSAPAGASAAAISQQPKTLVVMKPLCFLCSERATAVLGQLSWADTKGDAFLTGVQLIAHGCQRAFEVSDLPGLLPALTKVIPVCFVP